MDKYKVILVDDEEEVIDVIERKIHWDMLGFDVVGSANNGVKALELVEKQQPDVVITDIKMPYMDGLELSRRLNNDKIEHDGKKPLMVGKAVADGHGRVEQQAGDKQADEQHRKGLQRNGDAVTGVIAAQLAQSGYKVVI